MSDQYVGEIRIFPFNFAPYEWAACDGQLLPLSQNAALFSLLGTYYGGNGSSNFALPNFQGCRPVMAGQAVGLSNYNLGQTAGSQTVTLISTQIPAHTHQAFAYAGSGGNVPASNTVCSETSERGLSAYAPTSAPTVTMSPSVTSLTGGGLPHDNMQPYLTLNFCVALTGIYPSRS